MILEPCVFVVDDDPAAGESVVALAESHGVRARAYPSAGEFLAVYDRSQPGCLVTDLRMPDLNGVGLLEEMKQRQLPLPAIVISGYASVEATVLAMQAGAVTLLQKPYQNQDLWNAIQQAVEQDAARRAAETRRQEAAARLATLSQEELQVLDLVLTGLPNKAIAIKLLLGQRTVDSRRQSIMAKMQASSVAELVRLVLEARQEQE